MHRSMSEISRMHAGKFGPSTIKVAELSARNCSVQIFYKSLITGLTILPRPHTPCLALQKDRLPATTTFRRHSTPSTIKVARSLHVFVLGRNIQQSSHRWTETQACTEACQKVAECTLASLGPQRSRWQSFPHGTAQCKYSTSHSSPGSPYCRVHIPHALHCKRTGCLQRQHSEGNAQQTVAGAFHALKNQGGKVSARLCAR